MAILYRRKRVTEKGNISKRRGRASSGIFFRLREWMNKHRNALLIAAICVCGVLFAFAIYMLITQFIDPAAQLSYKKIKDEYSSGAESEDEPNAAFYVDFEGLEKENDETVSWIRIDGTVIDYPIVQGEDNDYYVSHTFDGEKSKSGSIFIDYRNTPGFADKNTLIYGHHMKNGTMFASIVKYIDQDYLSEHQKIIIKTPEKDYIARVFSAYVTPSYSDSIRYSFADDSDYANYLELVSGLSKVATGIEPSPEDRIITLITCTYEYDDARFLVHAVLEPVADVEGEE